MPVPVPKYSRLPAHPVVKHSAFFKEGRHLFSENTTWDLATCSFSTSELSLGSEIYSNPFNNQTLGKEQSSFASTKLGGTYSPSLCSQPTGWEKDRSHCGLTGAANAPISKEKHAEACFLPFSDEEPMTVDFCSGPGAVNTFNSGYETDSDTIAPLRRWFSSTAWTQAPCDANAKYLAEEHTVLVAADAGLLCDSSQAKSSNRNEIAITPFADFVDRVVASDATRPEEHFYMGSRTNTATVQTPRRQQELAPQPIENVADSAYIKAYRAVADPMSDWIGDYIWKVCTTGLSLPQRFVNIGPARHYPEKPPVQLSRSIRSLLCSTLLQPSGILLALWYIARLPVYLDWKASDLELLPSEMAFRNELFGEGGPYSAWGSDGRALFRLVILGCMLANKWLDDHTFSNKTWHSISEVPLQSINRLEFLALIILSHDLSIPELAWSQWLTHLKQYNNTLSPFPAPIRRPSAVDVDAIVRKLIDDLIRLQDASPLTNGSAQSGFCEIRQPIFIQLVHGNLPIVEKARGEFVDLLEIDLDEDGPLREEYVPKRRVSYISRHRDGVKKRDDLSTSPVLPPPSKWSPEADPFFNRADHTHDKHFAVQPVSSQFDMSFRHTRSSSSEVMQQWTPFKTGYVDSNSANVFTTRSLNRDQINRLESHAPSNAFPLTTACPPWSYTRSTLNNLSSNSAHGAAHSRSHSQSRMENDSLLIPTCACGHVNHSSSNPTSYGDPGHFRPLWLRT